MLIIYPPVAKPSEPPAGAALLAGTLQAHQHQCAVVDLNIEGLLYLLTKAQNGTDNWSKRAFKNRNKNLADMRSKTLYTSLPRYQKTVLELNRLIEKYGNKETTASLANYHDSTLSPLKSGDLHYSAEFPEENLFFSFFQQTIPALIEDHDPKFIGISINYLSQALTGFALLGCIKKIAPHIKIIIGGGLITSWMRSPFWKNPFKNLADFSIDGCGEKPLLDLLETPMTKPAIPCYDQFQLGKYLAPGFILPYSCSSGCFWNKCSFCPERAEGNFFTGKAAKQVHDDIIQLKKQTHPVLLHFLDNALPPAVLKTFNTELPGMPWYGFVRVTNHFLDEDYCRDLKKSGCVMLKLGIESGDQRVLDRMEKGIDLHSVSRALKNLHRAGIATYVYLLFGTPEENYAAAKKTLDFTAKHHQCISFLNLAIFNMPINTGIKSFLPTAQFNEGDLSLYTDFSHPHGWNRKKVRTFLDREFKRNHSIKKIIQRDPAIFTSNHAPFFQNVSNE